MTDRIQEQNVKYYDAEAGVYDVSRYGSTAGRRAHEFHKRLLGKMLDVELSPESNVLEVGCGTGRFLPYIAERVKSVEGLDVSPGMIEVAQALVNKARCANVNLTLYDGQTIPFEDETFDCAYSIFVINLIPDYVSTFREVARILRPGGTFIFNVPNLAGVYFPAGMYVNLRGKTRTANEAGHRHSHWFMPREWRSALAECGMTAEMMLGEPPHVRLVENAPILKSRGLGLLLSKSVFVKARRT